MAKMKVSKTHSVTGQVSDQYVSPTLVTSGSYTDHVGAVGGDKVQTGPQIHAQVRIKGQSAAEGSILLMKGAHKHYAMDAAGHKGQCTLVNKAKASLAESEMSITVTLADASTFYAKKITNKFVWDFSNNKYRYWHNSHATTSNTYAVDYAAGTVGFVKLGDAT